MRPATPTFTPESFTSFGALLRYLRVRAHLSQRELSIAVGYSEAHISRLEQNSRRPDRDAVLARFVPALLLDDAPAWAARLIELLDERGPAPEPAPADGAFVAVFRPAAALPPPAAPLVRTKLFAPRLRPDAVSRPRLYSRLDAALNAPLTLVAAPAGFGKSSLLAAWLAEKQKAKGKNQPDPEAGSAVLPFTFSLLPSFCIWLTLDSSDNDPATFVRYLVAALGPIASEAGQAITALLHSPQLLPIPSLLTPLLNELSALEAPCVLVLDDYHLITAQAVHDALVFLIERMPYHLHLVIATRVDPPLPLARLRARGQLCELRARELRFDLDEAALFLRAVADTPLTDAEVVALERRTEGWVTGLQLAALAMRERTDRAGFVAAFAGSDRYILDYLAEEVLNRLPNHLRRFLLQTSILNRLCGSLCDELLGLGEAAGDQSYSQLLLAELERLNLFLVPLDNERRWYRYHHLFADVLRAQLRQGASDESVAALHGRASAWFERLGLPGEAISHALAARLWETAARLIEERAGALLEQGEHMTVRAWLDALPPPLTRRSELLLLRAALEIAAHNPDAADAALADLEPVIVHEAEPTRRKRLLSEAAVYGAAVAIIRNEIERTIELCLRALADLDEGEIWLRGQAMLSLGNAYGYKANNEAAISACAEASRLCLAAGNVNAALFALSIQAVAELRRCQFAAAGRIFAEALRLAAHYRVDSAPAVGQLQANYAELLCELNDLDAAEQHGRAAIAHGERVGTPRSLMIAYANTALILVARRDFAGAASLLEQAEALVRRHGLPISHSSLVDLYRVQMWLAQGNLTAAAHWVAVSGISTDDPIDNLNGLEYTALARVLIGQGESARALTMLDRMLSQTEADGQRWRMITILALEGLAAQANGYADLALQRISQALNLAAPNGFVRTFIDEGQPMGKLLRTARAHGIQPAYCDRLLTALGE